MKIDAIQKQEILNSLNIIQQFVENVKIQTNCNTCIHYDNDKCALVDAVPPHNIIDNGCESWKVFDDIPF